MPCELFEAARRLSDEELVFSLKSLAGRERDATVELVAHIAELDTRDLHLRAGYGSLFVYCRDVLLLSEHEAYNRIEAARAVRRHPMILGMLQEGTLNLTTVRLLARHLTAENHARVLESARGKKKTEVEEIVAGLWPQPDAPPVVRRLPFRPVVPGAAPAASSSMAGGSGAPGAPVPPMTPAPVTPFPVRPAAVTTSLSPDRYKLQFTIGTHTLEKLRLAKDMLRHAIPSGDEAAILDRALTVLLAELARKKFAATEKPRPASGTAPGSRHVPAEVKRAVWLRDGGQCAFVGRDGRRCGERAFLEFHHVKPWAVGGEPTVANVQLRCRRHNSYEAKLYFGDRPGDGSGLVKEGDVTSLPVPERVRDASVARGRSTTSSPATAASARGRSGPGGTRCGPPRAGPGAGRSDLRRGGGGP